MSDESTYKVSIFGAFDVVIDGKPEELGVSGPTRSLLQYLICAHGRPTRREQLMEMFWPDSRPERRRSSLNSAIWRTKKALGASRALRVHASADSVRLTGLTAEGVEIDFMQLETGLNAATSPSGSGEADLAALMRALENCAGVPLDGVDDDWAAIERERLSALRVRGLTVAMRMLGARRRYDDALEIGRALLVHEPYRECAFQELLCLHVLNGERARALRLFDEFAATLRSDLGLAPMVETRALRDYLAGDRRAGPKSGTDDGGEDLSEVCGPGLGVLLTAIRHSRELLQASA